METEFKVPSDLPTDPIDEGDAMDSPIPAVQDEAEQESDDSFEDADGDDADAGEEKDADDAAGDPASTDTPE